MRKFVHRLLWIIIIIFLVDIGISLYLFTHSLQVRFPNLDFSKARFGVASWYSKTDKGINEHTANGEKFNDKRRTCASWDYPFGTKLLVINPLNGRWVVCRVNDRGPAKHLKREVDLTKATFQQIANPKRGLLHVIFIRLPEKK